MTGSFRLPVACLLALCLTVAAGCAYGPTPYQAGDRQGFSDVRLEADRYRVAFRGNSVTDRETVELYLLFRAAELTIESGFDSFSIVERATDRESRISPMSSSFEARYSFVYFHPRFGWVAAYDPLWSSVSTDQVTRFEATAEIVMTAGPKGSNVNSFDARDVIKNLADRIIRPDPRSR